jgi:hypothetical protein
MNKRVIVGSIIIIVIIALVFVTLICVDEIIGRRDMRTSPSLLTSYPSTGYYQIDPETILSKLEQGKTDVFVPLLEDPDMAEPLNDVPYSWTQADFLEVASALGQMAWDDPMDLDNWSVYFVLFVGSCQDDPMGFDNADITYFKAIELDGEKVYTTRKIEIDPDYNLVRWGNEAIYPQSVGNWKGVDLAGAKITADDALRIAEENDGIRSDTLCAVYVSSPSSDNNGKWHLRDAGFRMYVDMETGKYEIPDSSQ